MAAIRSPRLHSYSAYQHSPRLPSRPPAAARLPSVAAPHMVANKIKPQACTPATHPHSLRLYLGSKRLHAWISQQRQLWRQSEARACTPVAHISTAHGCDQNSLRLPACLA